MPEALPRLEPRRAGRHDLLLEIDAPALPALQANKSRGPTEVPKTPRGEPQEPLSCPLHLVEPMRLRRVEQPSEACWWHELVGRYQLPRLSDRLWRLNPLSDRNRLSRTPNPRLPLVLLPRLAHTGHRDLWIGWHEPQRKKHLPRLINNSRFLILPWVHISNLASHVLARALKTVSSDWEYLFGLMPWLVETLVDPARFTGHCYRAANWIEVGLTTGRGRQDREHALHGHTPKHILLYPLRCGAQRLLYD